MSKTPTDLVRHALTGATMGTHWTALFYASAETDLVRIRAALAQSVALVDRQMSTWKPDSNLTQLNRAPVGTPVGTWYVVPAELMAVLDRGVEIGRLSDGAFDIGLGDIVTALGFGPHGADPEIIRASLGTARRPTLQTLELAPERLQARKHAPLTLDLSGITNGYAVDRMMAALTQFGVTDALVGLDGEMRACGHRPDGRAWTVAIERPDSETCAPLSVVELNDAAIATSDDYRHWVDAGGKRLSHTMDRNYSGPLKQTPASVTVLATYCMQADAWATAFMVAGEPRSTGWSKAHGLTAVFIHRDGDTYRQSKMGFTH